MYYTRIYKWTFTFKSLIKYLPSEDSDIFCVHTSWSNSLQSPYSGKIQYSTANTGAFHKPAHPAENFMSPLTIPLQLRDGPTVICIKLNASKPRRSILPVKNPRRFIPIGDSCSKLILFSAPEPKAHSWAYILLPRPQGNDPRCIQYIYYHNRTSKLIHLILRTDWPINAKFYM